MIWGAGEILDCVITAIPYRSDVYIVDKTQFGQKKSGLLKEYLVEKPESISEIKPDIIIVASKIFYDDICQEIEEMDLGNIDIVAMADFGYIK